MDPNATLAILRQAVAEFQEKFDAIGDGGATTAPVVADELIDIGNTIAEAFASLDGWITQGGFIPILWTPRTVACNDFTMSG